MRTLESWRLAFALLLALAFVASLAASADAATRGNGRLAVTTPGGGSGPIELSGSQAGWSGTFSVTNVGNEPLSVSRISIRGSDDDVRSPPRLSVRFLDGPATTATLAPGTSRDAVVTWRPADSLHVRQAFGHVIVTSSDEAQGEAAMGFHANLPTPMGWFGAHWLSMLLVVPLAVPLSIALRRLTGRRDEAPARKTFAAAAAVELGIALLVVQQFVVGIGRADGNDGLQAIERWVWVRSVGAEYFIAVDGLSVGGVLLVAILALAAAALPSAKRPRDTYWAALAILVASSMLVLVAMDVVLLFAAWVLVIVSMTMVVASAGTSVAERSAAKVALTGTVGSAALLLAIVALSLASGHAFLVDGTALEHSLAIPDFGRANLAAAAPLLGKPFVAWMWGLLLVAVAAMTPVVPLHRWLPDAIEDAPTGAGVVLSGVVVTLGPYLLVRVGLQAMPDGARWASSSIATLGAIQVVVGACCALAQQSLRRFAAYATMTHAGVALFAVSALSPEGVASASYGAFAQGLAAATLLGAIAAAAARRDSHDLRDLRGLAHGAPALTVILGLALAASLGVPGLAWFWALWLSLLAAFARHRALAGVVAIGWVAFAAAHGRVVRGLVARPVAAYSKGAERNEPLTGRVRPQPTAWAYAALVPLVVVSAVLGLWPAPVLGIGAAAASDISREIDRPIAGAAER
ncbi:MAG: proton-conducting transporter membrane subunit [Polyangiaceae bacterium]|jgi:NADH-quinone oxidoreductase subunit M